MKKLCLSATIIGLTCLALMSFSAIGASSNGNASPGKDAQPVGANNQIRADSEWGPVKNWETEVMGVKVKGNAQRRGNEIRGVLHIYPPLSDRWTYHWTGRIDGETVVASHTDGHRFRGTITPEKIVVGEVITKDGRKIPLRAPLP